LAKDEKETVKAGIEERQEIAFQGFVTRREMLNLVHNEHADKREEKSKFAPTTRSLLSQHGHEQNGKHRNQRIEKGAIRRRSKLKPQEKGALIERNPQKRKQQKLPPSHQSLPRMKTPRPNSNERKNDRRNNPPHTSPQKRRQNLQHNLRKHIIHPKQQLHRNQRRKHSIVCGWVFH
jgi:hypothetical protein